MNIKTVFIIFIAGFVGLCAFLVIESSIFGGKEAQAATSAAVSAGKISLSTLAQEAGGDTDDTEADGTGGDGKYAVLNATHGRSESVTLGELYPEIERFGDDSGRYKFSLDLTSRGGAISSATLSEFDDRDPDEPVHLKLLGGITAGKTVYSLANGNLRLAEAGEKEFPKTALPLDKLHWRVENQYSSDEATFTAIVQDASGQDALKLIKTYRISPNSYDIECELTIENLSDDALKARFDMQGPVGMEREGVRADMRAVIAAFIMPDGTVESAKTDNARLRKAKRAWATEDMQLVHKRAGAGFLWAATTNKYFSAILRPVGKYAKLGPSQYYDPSDPSLINKKPDGDEYSSFSLQIPTVALGAKGHDNSSVTLDFRLYLGPKDRDVFNKNEQYKTLAYFHTIDFRSCFCCPASIIRPLAFGIMALMKLMYGVVHNYGVVIMILVFMMRLVMHPITKKSQVSMMRMQKLSPMMEEIKKKYAGNKAEMNKKVMALYRDQGISPFASMLPMLIQMPVWIALWTAVYASIDLRGAAFLPFWITDLSAPDALLRFKAVTVPLLGWQIDSFNLLPILMGVVMFLQQKLMPHSQSTAQTNPQVAQQQKMMMIMMPLLFPIMLYKGPSGVNLYIMSSISAGVIEQIVIRKHIREKEQAEASGLVAVTKKTGGRVKKKKPKPFFRDH
jgi:YidC/Oxa1 family membrane protein insertase